MLLILILTFCKKNNKVADVKLSTDDIMGLPVTSGRQPRNMKRPDPNLGRDSRAAQQQEMLKVN